jgi:hypothetical protein
MSKLTSLTVLLTQEIKDLYSAETQLVAALPKMAKASSDAALKDGFKTHLEETKVHVERLDQVAKILGVSPKGKVCKAMKGLVEEGAETIEEAGDPVIKNLGSTFFPSSTAKSFSSRMNMGISGEPSSSSVTIRNGRNALSTTRPSSGPPMNSRCSTW